MKEITERTAMIEAGQVAYEVMGSRRRNDEEASERGNYYHWKIKLVCAVCKHVQSGEQRTGWMGSKDYITDNRLCCESCDTMLIIRKHTDWWASQAKGKNPNILALGFLKHYPY